MRQHVNSDESAIKVRINVLSEALDLAVSPRAKHVLGCGPNKYLTKSQGCESLVMSSGNDTERRFKGNSMIVFLIIILRNFRENNIFQSILRLDTDYRK